MDISIKTELKHRRRERIWRQIRNMLILLLICAAIWKAWSFIHDPDFAFGTIQVSGTRKLANDDILEMSGCRRPVNIINLNAARVEEAIKHDVRFVSGNCRYEWPGVFHVSVIERSPAIFVSDSYGSYVKIDYEGVIMSVTKGVPDSTAPVLMNESLENVFVGDVVNNPRILAVLKFMNGLTFEACQNFSEIRIDGHNNLHITLKTGLHVVVGILSDAVDRSATFMTIFNELNGRAIDVEFIDMRFNKPYIRLRNGGKKKEK